MPPLTKKEKKVNNSLTLGTMRATIRNKMIEVRTDSDSEARWDRHMVLSLLQNLLIELEAECHNN